MCRLKFAIYSKATRKAKQILVQNENSPPDHFTYYSFECHSSEHLVAFNLYHWNSVHSNRLKLFDSNNVTVEYYFVNVMCRVRGEKLPHVAAYKMYLIKCLSNVWSEYVNPQIPLITIDITLIHSCV